MTNYQQLAEEIRAKRDYREAEDGTIFCSISRCPGSVGLRCYRTQVPICKNCSVHTPVGYLSKEAAREQQDHFFDAETKDYVIAGITAFFSNLVIGAIATQIGQLLFFGLFFGLIFMFFISASAASVISELIWRALRKKRGRYTGRVAVLGLVLSSLLLVPFTGFLITLIYAGVVTTTVNTRFQMGIRL